MTTPKREEIIEKAFQLHHERSYSISTVTPAVEELKENGDYAEAQKELMRNEERSQVLNYLEQLANEHGFELVKTKAKYSHELEPYPIEAIMTEGCFVTGSRGCGKTNLIKLLVMEALKHKVEVKVFDPSLAWKRFPLPKIKVTQNASTVSKWNAIYDISRLSVLEAREFLRDMLAKDLIEAIHLTDVGMKPKCLVVIEEAQNIIPSHSLREKKFLDISRFVTQGRNFGLSFLASTQRLSSVDVNLIEISGTRYWFKLEGHRNLVKARYWLDKFTAWRLRDLKVGVCYLQRGSKIKRLRLPLFKAQKVIAQ